MDDNQRALLCLFERPFEKLKFPRANGMIQFQQTMDEEEAISRPMEPMEDSSDPRYGSGAMRMNIPAMPDDAIDKLEKVLKVPKGIPYSHFDPVHVEAAEALIEFFMDTNYVEKPNYWQYCGSVRESVNEWIFVFALSSAILRNPAIDSRNIPALCEIFPNTFFKQPIIDRCKDMAKAVEPEEREIEPVDDEAESSETGPRLERRLVVDDDVVDFSGWGSGERRLDYWREDYGMNSHHWHWHQVYPRSAGRDRQGEMFYYMHNQMLVRYDWERLSNNLKLNVALTNWDEPIPEGYFPDLTFSKSSRQFGNRPDNMTLREDVIRRDMIDPRDRLLEAVRKGYLVCDGNKLIKLSDNVACGDGEKRGIDILGDTLEPNDSSVNFGIYGYLHNDGHSIIGRIHDPVGQHGAPDGIMRSFVSVRDPVFYRWHKYIDDICQEYKMNQEPYEDEELVFGSVELESLSVKSGEREDNILETGWTFTTFEASRGLDFGLLKDNEKILIRTKHLSHYPFKYNMQVTNNENEPVDVTVRLYMAPKFSDEGKPMTYNEQRLLWAEMDKFKWTLDPDLNTLERESTCSSITIPGERTFREIERNPQDSSKNSDYCGCGWPQHLLLPKGKPEGMEFQIFALISDWKKDKINCSALAEEGGEEKTCSKNAASYCGIMDGKYPDSRPMGYPFDRKLIHDIHDTSIKRVINRKPIENASDFANALLNAAMTDITILFKDDDLFPDQE